MKRILKDGSIIFLEEIVSRALNFIVTMVIVRALSKEHFGLIVTASAILNYAVTAASMGLKNIGFITTSTPKEKRSLSLSEIYSVKITLSIVVSLLFSLIIILLPISIFVKLIYIIYLGNVLFEGLYLDWYYRGISAFKEVAKARIICSLLYTGSITVLLQAFPSVISVAMCFLFWNLAQAIFLFFKSGLFRIKLSSAETLKKVMIQAFPVGGGTLLQQLPLLLPPLLLTAFHNASYTAEYGATLRIVTLIRLLDPVVANLYLSSLPKLWSNSPERARVRVEQVIGAVSLVLITVTLCFSPLSGFIMKLIYGDQYGSEPVLLPLFSFFVLATILNTILSLGLIAITDNSRYFKVSLQATIVALPFMPLVVIPLGTIGAVLAVVGAEAVITIFSYRIFKRHIPLTLYPLIITILFGVTGTVTWYLGMNNIYWITVSLFLIWAVSELFRLTRLLKE